jgi:hypothetical protein
MDVYQLLSNLRWRGEQLQRAAALVDFPGSLFVDVDRLLADREIADE